MVQKVRVASYVMLHVQPHQRQLGLQRGSSPALFSTPFLPRIFLAKGLSAADPGMLKQSYPVWGGGSDSNGCALPALPGWLLSVWMHLTGRCWHQIDVPFVPDKDLKSPLGSSSNSFILPDCGIRARGVPRDASIAELQAPRLLSAEMMEKLQEWLSFLPVCVLFSAYQ